MTNKHILLLFVMFNSFVELAMSQAEDRMKPLRALVGNWKMGKDAKVIYEDWKMISEKELFGRSYTIRANDTLIFEEMRIVEFSLEPSDIAFIAKVKNQNGNKEVPFSLRSLNNRTFTFENPDHDFPQRVIYQFISSDSLHAWIEGTQKGKAGREDFYYSRTR